ncbi:hypothetical protein LRY60_00640 [Candidatus Woesebacteria bacterium]|nr:hypothetical protein [Candidatus Woesebacteria bacterium]
MPDQTSTPTSLPSANPTAPTPAQQPNTTGDQTALPIDPTTGQPVQPTSRRQKEVAPGVTTPITESSANFASSEALTQTTENISTGPVEVEPPKELEPEVEKSRGTYSR